MAWWTRAQSQAASPPTRPGVLGSLTGVAMFPKCCDPSGLCSAGNSIRAGGLDDGRYGSEELGLPPEPLRGAAEERGAVVTLHSGQSCRGIPGLHGSTTGIGPERKRGWLVSVDEGKAFMLPSVAIELDSTDSCPSTLQMEGGKSLCRPISPLSLSQACIPLCYSNCICLCPDFSILHRPLCSTPTQKKAA